MCVCVCSPLVGNCGVARLEGACVVTQGGGTLEELHPDWLALSLYCSLGASQLSQWLRLGQREHIYQG